MGGRVVMALYNEIEPFAAAWLGNLSAAGHIAPGAVDARSIKDLGADDVRGVQQAHFFAGIGVWSYALRLAGWPDDRPVWTGSCPCQPFSVAGRRGGLSDERHLWPEWFRLIRECRPPVVFGEQVASPAGRAWLDAVSDDLEREGYAVGAADLAAASVGAPHIRQRLYFVAVSERAGVPDDGPGDSREASCGVQGKGDQRERVRPDARERGDAVRRELADDTEQGRIARGRAGRSSDGRDAARVESGRLRTAGLVGDADAPRSQGRGERRDGPDERLVGPAGVGFWRDCDWIHCRDGKARPVEPGTFPLVDGAPARVGRLRGFGNAIVGPLAAQFIGAAMEAIA